MPRDWSRMVDGWARRRAQPAHRLNRGEAPAGKPVRMAAAILAMAGVLSFGIGAMANDMEGAANGASSLQFAAGSANFEAELWTFIKDGDNADDFEAFLAIFPDGNFAGSAKDKLARLRSDAPAATRPKPALPSVKIAPIKVTPTRLRRAARTNVRVRARPDTSSATITIISRGQVLTVTGKVAKSDWVRAELPGGRRGYIYGPLLGPVPIAKPAPYRQPDTHEPPKRAAVTPAQPVVPATPTAPTVDLAAQRAEITARWDQKIGLIRRTGEHTECYSAGESVDMDSTEYMDCTDREATIARLEAAKQAELAALSGSR